MIQENVEFYEKLTACFGSLSQFERKICQIAEMAGVDLAEFEIDHLAVRVNTAEKAEQWKALLLTQGRLLKESSVNGRPIALIEFNQPLLFCNQRVSVLELPFPKGKIYPEEGWEHIELVFPMQEGESVNEWIARTLSHFHLEENPNIKLKISQPCVESEQLPNPTVAINLKNVTYCNFCCLKIHPYDIKAVIHSECC